MTGLFSDWDIELDLAARVLDLCRAQGLKLATAESCTGGLIAGCLTSIAGSSEVLTRSLVVYDNAAKSDLLGVDAALFDSVGAVSEEVARAMAEGALAHPGVDIAIADTGIAGPNGSGDWLQYKAVFVSLNGCRTPRLEQVRVEFEQ